MFKQNEKDVGAKHLHSPVTDHHLEQFHDEIAKISEDYHKELQYNSQRKLIDIQTVNYIKTMCYELSKMYRRGDIWKHAEKCNLLTRYLEVKSDGTYRDIEKPVYQIRKTSNSPTIADHIARLMSLLDAKNALQFARQFVREQPLSHYQNARDGYDSITWIMVDGSLLRVGQQHDEIIEESVSTYCHVDHDEVYRLITEDDWKKLFGEEQ